MRKMRLALLLVFVVGIAGMGAADSKVMPESEPEISYGFTDTIHERANVSEYDTSTFENGSVKDRNWTGWHWEKSGKTYLFDVGGVWKDTTSRFDDGSPKDVELTVELEPNNLTKLLQANKEPWKSIGDRVEYFNKNYYFKGGNITASEFSSLESEVSSIPVSENGDLVKTTDLKEKAKNVTAKVKLRDSSRDASLKIGSESTVVAVSGGSDDSYNKFKPVEVTSASGTPTISKAQPVILSCGDDSTTGTGNIVIDCGSVDGIEDIDFSNTNNERFDYEIESFNLDTGGEAAVWVYKENGWVRDGTPQMRVHYGSGSTDEQDVTGTWDGSGQNEMIYLFDESSGSTIDHTSNGHDSTQTTGTTYLVDGNIGYARSFDGSDDWVRPPQDMYSTRPRDTTIDFWVKPDDQRNSEFFDFEGDMYVQIVYNSDGTVDAEFYEDGNFHRVTSSTSLSPGTWYHIAAVYDNSGAGIELFIDGVSEGSTTGHPTAGIFDTFNSNIMANGGGSGGYGDNPTAGDMSKIGISREVKSRAWMQAEYDASPKAGQVFFSQQAATTGNQAPQFDSTSVSPDPPLIGENVSYTANTSDPDGSVQYVNLSVDYGSQTVVSQEQRTGANVSWSNVYELGSGNKWLNATFTAVDDAGATTTQELNRYVEDARPSFQINDPENITYTTPDIPYQVDFNDDGDNDPDEQAYCEAYNDGNLVRNETVNENNAGAFSGTVQDVAAGNHFFSVECTEFGVLLNRVTNKSVQYSNENGPPSIDSFTASPSTDWQKGEQISFSFDISDGFDNITYVNLTAERDGTQIASQNTNYNTDPVSDTINDFFEVMQIGNYTVELTAQDEQAQVSTEYINQSVEDTYPPTTTTNLTSNTFYKSPVYVELTATDEESMIANLSYSVDSANYTTVNDSSATVEISGFGDHTLDFYAWDTTGNQESVNSEIISLEQLEANFFYNPSNPYTGETVTFDAGTAQGNITQYEWDFQSDGTYDATGEVVTNVYNNPGIKDVTLRVTDNDGNTDTYTESVEVLFESENKSLVESCPDTPFCRTNGSNPVTINGSLTAEDGNQSFTYEVNATGSDGDYDFFAFYNSSSNRLGQTQYSDILNVTIASNETNIPPSADFSVSLSGLSVDTDASSSSDPDGTITDYRWDWTNDGSYEDTGLTASHTYPSAGDYTIKLQVEDNNGSTSSLTKTVSVSKDTNGGGGTPPDDGEDNETTDVSSDGAQGSLLAPHSGARYGGAVDVIDEGSSSTVTISGTEHTFEVVDVENQQDAELLVDGTQRQVSETKQFTLDATAEGFTGGTLIIDQVPVTVSDVVFFDNQSGAVALSVGLEPGSQTDVPFSYTYEVNDSASFTTQYRESGIGNNWQNISTLDVNSPTNRTLRTDFQVINESGIYETRLAVTANSSTNYTLPKGFYIGDVPAIEILNPEEGATVKAPRTATKDVPLDYRFQVIQGSNVTGIGQYYYHEPTGDITSLVTGSSIAQVQEQDTFFENLADAFGYTFEEAYGKAFSWLVPTEPDIYRVNSTMQVDKFGNYRGYVNATLNDSGSVTTINSLPRNIEVVPQSTEEYIDDNKESQVVKTGNRTFDQNFTVDQDGDGTAEEVSVGTLVTGLDTPTDNAEIEMQRLDQESIEFNFFALNVNGTAVMNKSLVLTRGNSTFYNRSLPPSVNDYSVTLNGSQVGTWEEGSYDWHIEYFEPGTNDTLLYSSTEDNIVNTFTVDLDRGPIQSFRYFFDQLKETFANQLNTSKALAGVFLVLLFVVPWYVAARYFLGDHLLGLIVAGTVYMALAWVQLPPKMLNLVIMLALIAYVAGKFVLWVVGSG